MSTPSNGTENPLRFVLTAVIFVGGLFLVDRGVATLLDFAFSFTTTGEGSGQANSALANRDRDVVFFGSSRARQQFDPQVVHDEIGLSAYNAGANGQGLYYARLLERLMLGRGSSARYFVLQVDEQEVFGVTPARVGFLRPFAREEPLVGRVWAEADPYGLVKLRASGTYRYNSVFLSMMWNLLRHREADEDGFVPRDAPARENVQVAAEPSPRGTGSAHLPSHESRELIQEFVLDARRSGIRTLLVSAPTFVEATTGDGVPPESLPEREAWATLAEWARDLDIPYLSINQVTYPVFARQDLYLDSVHLNVEGAEILSRIVARELAAMEAGERAAPAQPQETP